MKFQPRYFLLSTCFAISRWLSWYLWADYPEASPIDLRSQLKTWFFAPLFGSLGEGSCVHYRVHIEQPENIFLGRNVYIPASTDFMGKAPIIIGDNVLIGPRVSFYTNRHNYEKLNPPIKDSGGTQRPISIGRDSWIGGNVVILPNVKIGRHCVIGAGSIVTKSIPDNCVAVGNPARVIKRLQK